MTRKMRSYCTLYFLITLYTDDKTDKNKLKCNVLNIIFELIPKLSVLVTELFTAGIFMRILKNYFIPLLTYKYFYTFFCKFLIF